MADRRDETETWFIRRGLPHFIDDYRATEDVLTRALPLLVLYFLFTSVAALRSDWPLWGNLAVAAGGFAILVGIWALINRSRGRPLLQLPDRVGPTELGVFILGPALLPLIFGGQVGTALLTAAGSVLFLLVVYYSTSYGLVAILRWAGLRVVREVGATMRLFARALPLLLLFTTFLFINAEAWQVTSRLPFGLLAATVGLFVILGAAFLLARLGSEVDQLGHFEDAGEVERWLKAGPMAGAKVDRLAAQPLVRRQRVNVGLLVMFAQGLQILFVSVLVGGFFVVFGLLIMRPETISGWTGTELTTIGSDFEVFGGEVVLTRELLKAATFLAGFAGLYFAVTALTDTTYRKEFFEEVTAELREAFAVREAYLVGLGRASDELA